MCGDPQGEAMRVEESQKDTEAGTVGETGATEAKASDADPCNVPCITAADRLHIDMPLDQYIALCQANSEAPIKREYARLVSSRVPYWVHVKRQVAEPGDHPPASNEGSPDDPGKPGTSGNGTTSSVEHNVAQHTSKSRLAKNRQQALQERSQSVCFTVMRGRECWYGDACKYSHDVDSYLRDKLDDLVGPCPWLHVVGSSGSEDAQDGACPYGYACRFYGAHNTIDGESMAGNTLDPLNPSIPSIPSNPSNTSHCRSVDDARFWMDDGTVPTGMMMVVDVRRRVLRPINELRADVRMALRKRMYDFGNVEEVLGALGVRDTKMGGNKFKKRNKERSNKRRADDGAQDAAVGEIDVDRAAEGAVEDGPGRKGRDRVQKVFDARGKTYLAPLTTVGNLPFRRLCKRFGADITCGEMAMGQNLLQGHPSEWALLKRHPDEDFFGVQVCGAHPDMMAYCAQLIEDNCDVDFVDINCGCPIDVVVNKGAGSAVLTKPKRLEEIVRGMTSVLSCPVTIKMRRGYETGHDVAHSLIPRLGAWGASAAVLHGRSRRQRYSKPADWDYIQKAARESGDACQVIGNGDVYGWQDHVRAMESGNIATTYVARGALVKPWIFTEIKERRDWDISAGERLDIIRQFVRNGLEHWGSDSLGVENTRRFLLEWLSFAHRYIPVGLLEVLPQRSNWRPSAFVGRSDLETLLASPDPADWINMSTWFLGPTPSGYTFHAKHQAKSHATDEARESGPGLVEHEGEAQENG